MCKDEQGPGSGPVDDTIKGGPDDDILIQGNCNIQYDNSNGKKDFLDCALSMIQQC